MSDSNVSGIHQLSQLPGCLLLKYTLKVHVSTPKHRVLVLFIPQILNLLWQNLLLVTYNLFKNQKLRSFYQDNPDIVLFNKNQLISTITITQIRLRYLSHYFRSGTQASFVRVNAYKWPNFPFSYCFAITELRKIFS